MHITKNTIVVLTLKYDVAVKRWHSIKCINHSTLFVNDGGQPINVVDFAILINSVKDC